MKTKRQLAVNAANTVRLYLKSINREEDGDLLEHTYNLVTFRAGEHEEGHEVCWTYENVCKELLALLADPKISSKLPKYIQQQVGPKLRDMAEFFKDISGDATMAALDLEAVDQYFDSMTETDIETIEIKYRELLKEKLHIK